MKLKNFIKRNAKKAMIYAGALCTPGIALADDGNVITKILNILIGILQGDIARGLMVLSIIGIGYSWLSLGKISKTAAIISLIGIGLVFSAGWIGGQLIGK